MSGSTVGSSETRPQQATGRAAALSLAVAVALSLSVPAQAQGVLEEVVVTARKRAETLQDVPIAMSIFSEEQLERLTAVSLKDLKNVVPSLHYQDRSALQTEITIRGVGGDARNIGLESGVGMYIDGVYAGRTSAYNIDLADIAQLEVLRGPQGTLFGKNTTGGAINITTKKPTDEFRANGSLSFGNYGAVRFRGSVSGGLSENLAGKVTVATWDREGYLDNLFDGSELQSEERRSARGQLRYTPNANLEINFGADITRDDQDTILNQLGSPAAFGGAFFNENRFLVNTDQPNTTERDMVGLDLSVNYAFSSGHELTSITAWRDVEITVFSDIDQTPVDIFRSGPFTDNAAQFTQEVRLASTDDGQIDYVIGLFYYRQDADASRRIFAQGNPLFFTDGPVDTEALALFGNVDFQLTDNLALTTGLRITDETKEGSYVQTSAIVPPFNKDIPGLKISATEPSWTAALNYTFSEDLSAYGSVSRGFKSGGFNVDPLGTPSPLTAADITFDPEFVTTYELGLKAEIGGIARISGAVFFSDYKDRQVAQFESANGVPTVFVRNAGESEISGAELEFNVLAGENWQFTGALSYLDGEYTDFTGATAAGADFTGNATEKTPQWTASVGIDYRRELGAGEFSFSPQVSYQGETFLQPDNGPFNVENGYSLLDLRMGYEFGNGQYGVYLWGRNLTDELYKEFARQFQGSDQVLWGAPRTYGIEFTARLD